MKRSIGRVPTGPSSRLTDQAASHPDPSGFDLSRGELLSQNDNAQGVESSGAVLIAKPWNVLRSVVTCTLIIRSDEHLSTLLRRRQQWAITHPRWGSADRHRGQS